MQRSLSWFIIYSIVGISFQHGSLSRSVRSNSDVDFSDLVPLRKGNLLKFCANQTMAETYVKEINALIDNLKGNETYQAILEEDSKSFVNFLKNSTKKEIFKTDCQAYFTGLEKAKEEDFSTKRRRDKIAYRIRNRMEQVARKVTDGKFFRKPNY